MDVASPLDESSIEIPDSPDGFDKSYFGTSGQKEKENKKRRDKHRNFYTTFVKRRSDIHIDNIYRLHFFHNFAVTIFTSRR
jgi:hypothetical protein